AFFLFRGGHGPCAGLSRQAGGDHRTGGRRRADRYAHSRAGVFDGRSAEAADDRRERRRRRRHDRRHQGGEVAARRLHAAPLPHRHGDCAYVGQVADVPMMLIAKKATPAANFAEFLAYAKANKDKVSYANAGVGSASYLCGLLFMSAAQAEFTQVPYKGTGPAMNDLVGGQVDFMCDQTTNTVPQIK